MTATS